MNTCKERTGDVWSRSECGKPVLEVIEGNPLCKAHAKRYRIRRGMETGEVLETRYLIYELSLLEVRGITTKKYFVIREHSTIIGSAEYFYKTNIDIDTKYLFSGMQDAKNELARHIRNNISSLHGEIEKMEARLKKAEQ